MTFRNPNSSGMYGYYRTLCSLYCITFEYIHRSHDISCISKVIHNTLKLCNLSEIASYWDQNHKMFLLLIANFSKAQQGQEKLAVELGMLMQYNDSFSRSFRECALLFRDEFFYS